jgi:DNA topoisomerase I
LRGHAFEARLVGADGKKITRLDVGKGDEAAAFKAALEKRHLRGASIEAKPAKRHPAPALPDLDPAAGSRRASLVSHRPAPCSWRSASMKVSISAARPRASSPTCARTASTWTARSHCRRPPRHRQGVGAGYVPGVPRRYSTKAKNAQEAHEAIRPTDMGSASGPMSWSLEPDQAKPL